MMQAKTTPKRIREPLTVIKVPIDLRESLENAAQKIGITRNATMILAARKGIKTLAEEFTQTASQPVA